ncbi:MAG: LrgB family protein [Clostridia bacterium]|jgi:putative effector of murein hydrolase|nr:LrgB family protein [Clostridia bacterium]MDD4571042.1 LrgB family protein [Clostridia bacterium]
MIDLINSSPAFTAFFCFFICAFTYEIGLWLNRKTGLIILNPQLIAIGLTILILILLNINYTVFDGGANLMNVFLTPITVVLAVPIYKQIHLLKANALPIIIGAGVGSITSMVTVYLLCKAFHINEMVYTSLLAKSVTTPIGIEVSKQLGGIPSITIIAIIITGIFGGMAAPWLCRFFKIKNAIARGVAIGTCSHAMGTASAIEMGEAEGAMSGLAIGIAGLITIILALLIPW